LRTTDQRNSLLVGLSEEHVRTALYHTRQFQKYSNAEKSPWRQRVYPTRIPPTHLFGHAYWGSFTMPIIVSILYLVIWGLGAKYLVPRVESGSLTPGSLYRYSVPVRCKRGKTLKPGPQNLRSTKF